MKMNKWKKIMAAALSLLLAAGAAVPAFAMETAESGPKEEVVYIITDAEGNVENMNVVNIFSGGDVTDYGDYTAVKMLTTTDEITQNGDTVTFSSAAERVYYQGTMEAGTEIPWNISLCYELDGEGIAPAELAGKSGALKICFSITKNNACKGSFYEDYALQASLSLDTEKCKNISAEGATTANVGSEKQLSYTVLPGKGLDTVITADVSDFEMGAISINGIRLNLNVEIDDAELMDKVTELMDATKKLNDGAGELNDGTETLKGGSGSLKDGTASLQSGVTALDDGIADLQSGIQTVQSGLDTLNSQSAALTGGSSEIKVALQTIQSGLSSISVTADDLQALVDASGAIKTGIDSLYAGAEQLQANLGWAQYKALMSGNGLDIDTLKTGNAAAIEQLTAQISSLQATLSQIQGVSEYEEQATQLQAQIESLQTVIALLNGNNAMIGGTETYLDSMNSAAAQLTAGLDELKTSYEAFDSAIAGLVDTLSELPTKMGQLSSGINQLVSSYSELDSGITTYTDGVAALAAGYAQITDGVSSLASGSKELLDGAGALSDGAAELYDGVAELADGAGELADGTNELYTQTDGMDTEIQDKIDEILASFCGEETETVSFVSEKNTNVESVQFVIQTEAIEKADAVESAEVEEQSLTFWQKLLRLFGLY